MVFHPTEHTDKITWQKRFMVIIIMLCIDSNVLIFIFQSIIEKWFQ